MFKKSLLLVFCLLFIILAGYPATATAQTAEEHLKKGKAYYDIGEYKKAVGEAREALRKDSSSEEALDLLHEADLRMRYNALPKKAREAVDEGQRHMDWKRYLPAMEAYEAAIRSAPGHAITHFFLGNLYRKVGMDDKAVEAYKKAIKVDPDFELVHVMLASIYENKKDYDGVIRESKELIRINPYWVGPYTELGFAYDQKGLYDKAIASYKKALRISPKSYIAHNNLGADYLRKKMYDEAIKSSKKALEINPAYTPAFLNLGLALQHKGAYDEAIEALNKSVELGLDWGHSMQAHRALGVAYKGKEEYKKALKEYKEVRRIWLKAGKERIDWKTANGLRITYQKIEKEIEELKRLKKTKK